MTVARALLPCILLAAACSDPVAPSPTTTGEMTSTGSGDVIPTSSGDVIPTTSASSGDATTGPGEPVCCGCLCLDPAWSCSIETCLYADGTATALAPEAGFLTIAPHSFTTFFSGTELTQQAPEARMWYAFRPADDQPETRPLAVFFNGGPGYSSAVLFGLNTNAITLDPDVAGDQVIVANPHSWTRFANVLYVDPRQAGYSYDIAPADPAPPELEFSPDQDAADFVRLILAFLARHPQIQQNPVMLVGESYGGTRAAVMMTQILHPQRLTQTDRYRDDALHDALLEHFAVVFPGQPDPTPQVIAQQFGHQVLIQPALTHLELGVVDTPDEQQYAELACIPNPDVSQCDEPLLWTSIRTSAVIAALTDPKYLGPALGVDVASIAWMHADARAAAIPRGPSDSLHDEAGLRALFGELSMKDQYYYPLKTLYKSGTGQPRYGEDYIESFYYTRAFITNAGKDTVVYSPDIPAYLAAFPGIVTSVVHDTTPIAGEARPGWIRLTYDAKLAPGEPGRDVRFPYYPIGGHMVSHKQGGELADDVCRWFADDCPLP